MSESTDLTRHEKKPIMLGERGFKPVDSDDIKNMAELACKSGFTKMSVLEAVVAMAHGLTVGLEPWQAVQSIAVVNGRPCLWGDGLMGLVLNSGELQSIEYEYPGGGVADTDDFVVVCHVKRKGGLEVEGSFSVAQAKQAGLWDKDTYKKFPERMIKLRARTYALRDAFADVLGGFASAEEQQQLEPTPAEREQESREEAFADALGLTSDDVSPDPPLDIDELNALERQVNGRFDTEA